MTPVRHLPRFRRARAALAPLAERERWDRKAIETYQLDRVNQLWEHASAHVAHYRELRAAGLPPAFESLDEYREHMPFLAKDEVRERPDRFLSDATVPGGWRTTGGSTSSPTKIFWSTDAHREMLLAKYRHKQQWGLEIFDREAWLWGHSARFAPGIGGTISRFRQPAEDRLRNRLRLSAYDLDPATLAGYLEQLAAFAPRSMYAYPSAMEQLTIEAERSGVQLPSLAYVLLTGEPAYPHIVERIERHFGVPAIVEYGSHECGITAIEAPDRLLHTRDDQVLVETVPRSDGRWDIVQTPLLNPAFPLLRYRIADVTDQPVHRPAEGFGVLNRISGRDNDIIVGPDGEIVHPSRFDAFFKYQVPGVRRFRMHQAADGAIDLRLVVADDAPAPDPDQLGSRITELVGEWPVSVRVVDELERTTAGKHRMIISDRAVEVSAADDPAEPGDAAAESTDGPARSKAARLRTLIESPDTVTLMEVHSGLSARIAEEAGFEALWASGLAISACLGVRDSNEASWTQVLEVLEFVSDATSAPILVDGDTGYGNFNNMRRLVQKLEQRDIAGVCIEDKVFPKTNSFINGTGQQLADVEEFCGRIRAGCDARRDDDFVIVARVEAFIAGWGLDEALARASAYRDAGADAILIHSALRNPSEVIAFKEAWGDQLPVIVVPTKYHGTPFDEFEKHGFGAVIWANHLMRSSITAMQATARRVFEERSIAGVEDSIAPLDEVFRLQGAAELAEAEVRYLPDPAEPIRGVVLAAGRGAEMGDATSHLPKCMLPFGGRPLLGHIATALRHAGVRDITAVRGYEAESVRVEGISYVDASGPAGDAEALHHALVADRPEGVLVATDDVVFESHVIGKLLDAEGDLVLVVDPTRAERHDASGGIVSVVCTDIDPGEAFQRAVRLQAVGDPDDDHGRRGEWIGLLRASAAGVTALRTTLDDLASGEGLADVDLARLVDELLGRGHEIRVVYTTGSWVAIESIDDLLTADRRL